MTNETANVPVLALRRLAATDTEALAAMFDALVANGHAPFFESHPLRASEAERLAHCSGRDACVVAEESTIEPFTEYFSRFGALGHLLDFNADTVPEMVFRPPSPQEFEKRQRNLCRARAAHSRDAIRRAYALLRECRPSPEQGAV